MRVRESWVAGLRRWTLVAAVLSLVASRLSAQEPAAPPPAEPGAIAGRVIAKDGGRPVAGANVVLEGRTGQVTTDADGRFRLGLVPVGDRTIVIRAIGYQPLRLENIKVEANKTATVGAALQTTVVELQELVVESVEASRASSEAGQLALQAAAPAASDGISAETIAKSPDADAADAIVRVTGVTVAENKVVSRGIEERANNTLINGVEIASPEPLKRSVPLNVFDANLLESIIVSKSGTPDKPGDFVGGSVEIRTKDFPDNFGGSFSLSTEWNSVTTFQPARIGPRSFSDFLGYDDGSRAIPPGGPTAEDILPPLRNSEQNLRAEAFAEQLRNVWTPPLQDAAPNGTLSFNIGGQIAPASKTPVGYVGAINYSNLRQTFTDRIFRYTDGSFDQGSPFSIDTRTDETTTEVELSALANISTRIGEDNSFSWRNFYTRNTAETFSLTDGLITDNQSQPYSRKFLARYIERSVIQTQLSGDHFLSFLNNSELTWSGNYSVASRSEPENRELTYAPGDTLTYAAGTSARDKFQFREFTDKTLIGEGAFTYPFRIKGWGPGIVKAGGLYRARRRQFEGSFFQLTAVLDADQEDAAAASRLPPEQFFTPEILGDIFTLIAFGDPGAFPVYDGNDDVTAIFAMATVPLPLQAELTAGVRMEDWRATVYIPDRNTTLPPSYRRNRDYLWSVNGKLPLSASMNLRLGASASVVRPDLREIAPGIFFPIAAECGIRSDTTIQRSLVKNVDFKWEYFPAPTELVSVSAYYKSFDQPIINTLDAPAGSRCETSARNALSADVMGIELETRKQLYFLPGFLSKLSAGLNLSFISSNVKLDPAKTSLTEADLQNQSPFLFNGSLNYDAERFSAGLLYNYFGDRITQYGASAPPGSPPLPGKVEKGRGTLDAKVRYRFWESVTFTLAGRNLTNNSVQFTQEVDGEELPAGEYRPGVGVVLGVSYGF